MNLYKVQIEDQNIEFKKQAQSIDSLINIIEKEYKIDDLEKDDYEEFLYIGQNYYEGSELVKVYIEEINLTDLEISYLLSIIKLDLDTYIKHTRSIKDDWVVKSSIEMKQDIINKLGGKNE